MQAWYEELFMDYAASYDREVYIRGTVAEVDFTETEIGFDKTKTILDIGCGTGRHAIELARRGYSVTGIDLSESQLAKAQAKARKANVAVTFLRRDARDFHFDEQFDVVIMLCEGAFSLMETDEMNYNERYYAPSEIHWLLSSLNFSTIDILGCGTGVFHRNKTLATDDYEMLVIAKK